MEKPLRPEHSSDIKEPRQDLGWWPKVATCWNVIYGVTQLNQVLWCMTSQAVARNGTELETNTILDWEPLEVPYDFESHWRSHLIAAKIGSYLLILRIKRAAELRANTRDSQGGMRLSHREGYLRSRQVCRRRHGPWFRWQMVQVNAELLYIYGKAGSNTGSLGTKEVSCRLHKRGMLKPIQLIWLYKGDQL